MAKSVALDLEDLSPKALRKLVKQLLQADDDGEQALVDKILKGEKNDLADLHEEGHGKPREVEVTECDLPKKKGKK
jgi:hypothetical protein